MAGEDRPKLIISRKIAQQMENRGWSTELLNQTIASPAVTRTAINRANNAKATAYFRSDLSYIVVETKTNIVVQLSDRNNPDWKPDASIIDPPKKESGE